MAVRSSTGEICHPYSVKNVRRIYVRDHTQWGCDSRYPFLAYLLRVNRPEGTREFRRALQDREGNGCFRWMLWAIPRLVAAPELESVAIDTLADADAEVAATAAQFLSRQGSAAAEAHLWRCLEEVGGKTELADALRNALIGGQAWYFDQACVKRMLPFCGRSCTTCRGLKWAGIIRTRSNYCAPRSLSFLPERPSGGVRNGKGAANLTGARRTACVRSSDKLSSHWDIDFCETRLPGPVPATRLGCGTLAAPEL